MSKKIIFTFLLLMTLAVPFGATAERFYLESRDLELGDTETLEFMFENDNDYYGFQAEVKLPAGIQAVKNTDGELDITLSDRAAEGDYKVNSNILPNGTLIIGAFSGNHRAFSSNQGLLVNLKVAVADSFTGGYVEIYNVKFINRDDKDVELESSSSYFGVLLTGISFNKTELTLEEGDSETLTATIAPASATDKMLSWESSDSNIASVNDGAVTAVKAGTATITATSANGKTATCTVTVTAKSPDVVEVTGITLSKTELSLTEGEVVPLTAIITPDNATDKTVTWTSSDYDVVYVYNEGIEIAVNAVGPGNATITATSANGKTATCTVTVTAKAPEIVEVTGITLNTNSLRLTEGETSTLTATISPSNATDKSVTWSSSNPAVATVSSSGVVTAVKAGTATITATSTNGRTATCTVTVTAKSPDVVEVTGITLSKTELSLTEGKVVPLTAIITPDNATDKTVTWTTTDESVAIVSAEGVVTAVGVGPTTIVATSSNGKTATCDVNVAAKIIEVTGITLSNAELSLYVGDTAKLIATIAPENATSLTVTWSSSDETVATVDDATVTFPEGIINAISAGSATITATSSNGKTATCTVTVTAKAPEIVEVTGVALNTNSLSLTEGETSILTATIIPANATDKTVTWASSNTAVATVSASGAVTAVKAGTATITATSANGKTATCTVTVTAKAPEIVEVTGVTLNANSLSLAEGETSTLIATIAPENASDKSITWTSSDKNIATVSAEGVVTAVKAGSATISATSANGKTANCEVTVFSIAVPVESLSINPTSWSGVEGSEFKITVTVLPVNATDKSVSFMSTDTTVVTVDAQANVKVLKEGTCKIVVTTLDGSALTAECVITSTSGVAAIFADPNAQVDVYNMNGIILKRSCTSEDLKQLAPGMYILLSGNKVVKTVIND